MSTSPQELEETLPYNYLGVTIPANGSKYGPEIKQQAAMQWLSVGNVTRLASMMGLPERTVNDWSRSEWWQELTTKLHEEKKPEYNAMFSRLIEKSSAAIEQALDKNEVKAMDAAKIMGISFDKRQILNNQPTSISNNVTSEHLDKLKAMFEQQTAKTIDGEVIK